jgi:hypothetical protein
MPPAGFGPTIPAGERPQTYALDRAATGTGNNRVITAAKLEDTISIESRFSFLKHTKMPVCIRAAEWSNVKSYVIFSSPFAVVI